MFIIFVEAFPSFRGGITLSDVDYVCQFDYNQMADRWSFSMWLASDFARGQTDPTYSACPLIAGSYFDGGKDLIEELRLGHRMYAVDKRGIDPTLDWFQRFTTPLADGITSTFIVVGTDEEFTELKDNVNFVQPFC